MVRLDHARIWRWQLSPRAQAWIQLWQVARCIQAWTLQQLVNQRVQVRIQQWRVARLGHARILWLPSLSMAMARRRSDGGGSRLLIEKLLFVCGELPYTLSYMQFLCLQIDSCDNVRRFVSKANIGQPELGAKPLVVVHYLQESRMLHLQDIRANDNIGMMLY